MLGSEVVSYGGWILAIYIFELVFVFFVYVRWNKIELCSYSILKFFINLFLHKLEQFILWSTLYKGYVFSRLSQAHVVSDPFNIGLDIRFHLIVILICIFLTVSVKKLLFYFPSCHLCHPWQSAYKSLLPMFYKGT